jgi:hypothetical protein
MWSIMLAAFCYVRRLGSNPDVLQKLGACALRKEWKNQLLPTNKIRLLELFLLNFKKETLAPTWPHHSFKCFLTSLTSNRL